MIVTIEEVLTDAVQVINNDGENFIKCVNYAAYEDDHGLTHTTIVIDLIEINFDPEEEDDGSRQDQSPADYLSSSNVVDFANHRRPAQARA